MRGISKQSKHKNKCCARVELKMYTSLYLSPQMAEARKGNEREEEKITWEEFIEEEEDYILTNLGVPIRVAMTGDSLITDWHLDLRLFSDLYDPCRGSYMAFATRFLEKVI